MTEAIEGVEEESEGEDQEAVGDQPQPQSLNEDLWTVNDLNSRDQVQAQDEPQFMNKIDENRQKRLQVQNFLTHQKVANYHDPRLFGENQSQIYFEQELQNAQTNDFSSIMNGSDVNDANRSSSVVGPLSLQQLFALKEFNKENQMEDNAHLYNNKFYKNAYQK